MLLKIASWILNLGSVREPEHKVTISGYRIESSRKVYYVGNGSGNTYELALFRAQNSTPVGFVATGKPAHFQNPLSYSPRERFIKWLRTPPPW